MAKKKTSKRKSVPWNKGRTVGQRSPFIRADVIRIRRLLTKRGVAGLRDLALFSTAIDTMLRGPDLLGLKVKDVRQRNRIMRDTINLTTARGGQSIRCTLSTATMEVLEKWIIHSAKKPGNFLFTGRIHGELYAIRSRQLSRLVKGWATGIGLDESRYGTESLRRTRALYILQRSGNIEAVRALLGLKSIGTTARYLCDPNPVNAIAISRAHEI
jgi:integrase